MKTRGEADGQEMTRLRELFSQYGKWGAVAHLADCQPVDGLMAELRVEREPAAALWSHLDQRPRQRAKV